MLVTELAKDDSFHFRQYRQQSCRLALLQSAQSSARFSYDEVNGIHRSRKF